MVSHSFISLVEIVEIKNCAEFSKKGIDRQLPRFYSFMVARSHLKPLSTLQLLRYLQCLNNCLCMIEVQASLIIFCLHVGEIENNLESLLKEVFSRICLSEKQRYIEEFPKTQRPQRIM